MISPRVLITGAARGIGLALTRAYLARGAAVIAAARDLDAAADLRALAADAPGLTLLALDVASTESVRRARARCGADGINVLVNNAGVTGGPQRAPGMDLAQVERVMAVNAVGPVRVYDAFVDLVRGAAGARVIANISSEAGSLGAFRAGSKPEYAMSKAALNALTRWIAAREPSVVCVALDPGWTRTATGGPQGTYTPDETAARLVGAIDALTPAHSGAFLDAALAPLAW